jgi:CheY-like chemotaxis protein
MVVQGSDRPKVLIADDERVIADTLRTILNQTGFEAAVAYDGQDAIDVARVWKPDIFLSDVVMPGMSGIQAAIEICKMIPACRVLLFSGNASTPDLQRDASLRGHHFSILQKPVPPIELIERLRAIHNGA